MYTKPIPSYGDLLTVQEFLDNCESGFFIDYDGHGNPAKDGMLSSQRIYPSERSTIPSDATHVVWYNR